jgi:hypothetical protein
MSKELTNYSILGGLAIGFISFIYLFMRKSRPAPKEGEPEHQGDEQSAHYNKSITINSVLVMILTSLAIYLVAKTVGSSEHHGGGDLETIMTGSAPF